MLRPQPGIIPEPSRHALFLIWRVRNSATNGPTVAGIVAGVPALVTEVAALDRRANLTSTVGLGSEFWDVVSPGKRPAGLRPFKAIDAGGLTAPNTGGDVFCYINSKRPDLNFELAHRP